MSPGTRIPRDSRDAIPFEDWNDFAVDIDHPEGNCRALRERGNGDHWNDSLYRGKLKCIALPLDDEEDKLEHGPLDSGVARSIPHC